MIRSKATLVFSLLTGCLALATPAAADEEEFVLTWVPSSAPIEGTRLYIGTSSRQYGEMLDLGVVPTDSDGLHRITVVFDTATDLFVAMTVYDDELESDYSNEFRLRAPCTAGGCAPDGGETAPSVDFMAPIVHYLLNQTP